MRRFVVPARVRRWLRRHRRPAAALLLALAAGLSVHAVAGEPPPGVAVAAAARDLPAGQVLRADDVAVVELPASLVPDGTLASGEATGRALSSAVRRGEPLTDARLVGPDQLAAAPPGTMAVAVPVAEPATLAMVRPGDTVALLAASSVDGQLDGAAPEPAHVVVEQAVVLAQPVTPAGGLLDAPTGGGPVLVVAVSRDEALRLADASANLRVSVAILPYVDQS